MPVIHLSAEDQDTHSPSTNFLVDRDLPVPTESQFEKNQFIADFAQQQEIRPDDFSDHNSSASHDHRANLEVEPDDAEGSPTELEDEHPSCQALCASVAISTINATFPTVLSTPAISSDTRTKEIQPIRWLPKLNFRLKTRHLRLPNRRLRQAPQTLRRSQQR